MGQNRRPDEEGIKTWKKRNVWHTETGQNRRPDEEGIKTELLPANLPGFCVRTVDLMKKGLRPRHTSAISLMESSEP